jgi:ABC-type Fe3+/spermidine/putrescine transport system ATPase subunit
LTVSISAKNIIKRFGTFVAINGMSFDINPGEFVTLLGPSGCGKTTILRIIAGFINADEGEIYFDGKPMNWVDASKRNTAMVFQSYALFPHKTVYENIRFGLRMKKVPLAEQSERVREAMEIVNLVGLESRRPYELSGGQQQRVALARAFVTHPQILLFDEPLSNLDAKLRDQVREDIRRLQKKLNITTIYVTHDQSEALAISDSIIVMNSGKIEQMSNPREIYENSNSTFVANFIGAANLIEGTVVSCSGGEINIKTPIGPLKARKYFSAPTGEAVTVCIRPEDISTAQGRQAPFNTFEAMVQDHVYMGNEQRYTLNVAGNIPIRNATDKFSDLTVGNKYLFSIPAQCIHVIREMVGK